MAQDVQLTRQVQVLKMYTDVVMCSNASRNRGSQYIAPGGQEHHKAAAVTCIPSRRAWVVKPINVPVCLEWCPSWLGNGLCKKPRDRRSKSGASQKPVCRVPPLIIHAPPSH